MTPFRDFIVVIKAIEQIPFGVEATNIVPNGFSAKM